MSISALAGHSPVHGLKPPGAASGRAAASEAADSVANTGSVSADNMGAFFKSFSANLQSTLAQRGGAATKAAANQPMAGGYRYHLQLPPADGASVTGAIRQTSADVSRALKAYGAG